MCVCCGVCVDIMCAVWSGVCVMYVWFLCVGCVWWGLGVCVVCLCV